MSLGTALLEKLHENRYNFMAVDSGPRRFRSMPTI